MILVPKDIFIIEDISGKRKNDTFDFVLKGRLVKNMPIRVLDESIVWEITKLYLSLVDWKKQLWKENRKYHNKVKDKLEEFVNEHGRIGHYSMMGNEMYVERGKSALDEAKFALEVMYKMSDDFPIEQEKIQEFLDKIDSLLTLIDMTDHKKSIFSS